MHLQNDDDDDDDDDYDYGCGGRGNDDEYDDSMLYANSFRSEKQTWHTQNET